MRTATGLSWDQLRNLTGAIEESRDFSADQRRQAAKDGAALSDGSFPIYNQSDLDNAVKAQGRGNASSDAVRAHIMKRARALGLKLPDSWTSRQASGSN